MRVMLVLMGIAMLFTAATAAAEDVASVVDDQPQPVAETTGGESPVVIAQAYTGERGISIQEDYLKEPLEQEVPSMADPLEPLNKAAFEFNDRLYFWVMKPIAQGYGRVVPEEFRICINNFFTNLTAPVRIVNNLLQLRWKYAGEELVRFAFNSFAGIGGLGDMAKEALGIPMRKADTGQTIGSYGIDNGFYIVWPILGPMSLRDTFGWIGDRALTPLTWISGDLTFGESMGLWSYDLVNNTSLRIGDYEAFKEAAIDPYVSMRDAYTQNRKKAVEEAQKRQHPFEQATP